MEVKMVGNEVKILLSDEEKDRLMQLGNFARVGVTKTIRFAVEALLWRPHGKS